MKRGCTLLVLLLTLSLKSLGGYVVNGSFESASLVGWSVTGMASVVQKGLKPGSLWSAQINAATGRISQMVPSIGSEWILDFYVACQDPVLFGADRGFNLNINNSQLNMRIGAGGAVQFYNGSSWQTVGKGNEIAFSTDVNNDGDLTDAGDFIKVHRIQLIGHNYGLPNSSYDMFVSAENSQVLNLLAKSVTLFQSPPTTFATLIFTTAFGMQSPQSFLVDECSLVSVGGINVLQTGDRTIVEENGSLTDTIKIRLDSAPLHEVNIQVTEKNSAYLNIFPGQLRFSPANFSDYQAISIKAKDDSFQQGGIYAALIGFNVTSVDTLFHEKKLADIQVTIKDDDSKFVYPSFSGIYPHLAVTNSDGECGIGAVVPWQSDLWYVTYSAHFPAGSDDQLYQLDTALNVVVRPESVGGTPANRMIHKETNQLIIGSHIIDAAKKVRTIPLSVMPGRMTANARHLSDPANRLYFITMEEGIYDVNMHSLEFNTLHADLNTPGVTNLVPGAHMKGAYTGQGRLVLANNGNGGVLTQWRGEAGGNPGLSASWNSVDLNKYTEVTTKGGIYGSTSQSDPVWSLGWDRKSVLLNVCDNGGIWKRYRLPKASYSHDADHGWYTEWPRIRDVGHGNGILLANMHGMMYQFPANFSHSNTGGITPFSTFLKMIVDYAPWNKRIVLACNDATQFSNNLCPRDQSNLLFLTYQDLADYGGKPYAFGAVLMNDSINAGTASDAMLINGFENRMVHLAQNTGKSMVYTIETDTGGNNQWHELTKVTVPASGYAWYILPKKLNAQWLRVIADNKVKSAGAFMYLSNNYCNPNPEATVAIPAAGQKKGISFGILRSAPGNNLKLQYAATTIDGTGSMVKTYYEVDGTVSIANVVNPSDENFLRNTCATTQDFKVDHASVIMSANGKQYRLPMGDTALTDPTVSGYPRGIREVVTERSLMNIHGTFYELPREDAGGFIKIRPITTHNKLIFDFCSWRGMLVLSGSFTGAKDDTHYKNSIDGKAGLWFGNVDDLFKMGMPKGIGSTWKESSVFANSPSLPYLMQGYLDKRVELSHRSDQTVNFNIEVDYMADGNFVNAFTVPVKPGQTVTFQFPDGYQAQWVRTSTDKSCIATATFFYNISMTRENEEQSLKAPQLVLYPNPVNDILNIRGLQEKTNVKVLNMLGLNVISKAVISSMDVSTLPSGVYLFTVNGVKPVRFIKY